MSEHLEILIGIELGDLPPQTAVDWAITKLREDVMATAILELAWSASPAREGVIALMRQAIQEMHLSLPDAKEFKLLTARHIAQQIVDGQIDPNEGCSRIAHINNELNWPNELGAWGLLAHEQTGHEHIGITAESVRPHILEAARNLINET